MWQGWAFSSLRTSNMVALEDSSGKRYAGDERHASARGMDSRFAARPYCCFERMKDLDHSLALALRTIAHCEIRAVRLISVRKLATASRTSPKVVFSLEPQLEGAL